MSSSTATGSAGVQRELWGVRAQDWADAMEVQMRPLYDAVLERIGVGGRQEVSAIGTALAIGGAGLEVADDGPGLADDARISAGSAIPRST